jgi:hypothetical protein
MFTRYYLQRGYARRGDKEVLPVAGGRSSFDTCGDESTQIVGSYLSSHPEISVHDCGFGKDLGNPIRASTTRIIQSRR